MNRVHRYEIEGMFLEIPMCWDEHARQFVEDYGNIIGYPVFTSTGRPILLTIEDACSHARLKPGIYKDCGSCSYFHQTPGSLLGVCHNKKMRSGIEPQEKSSGAKEETL